MRIVTTGWITPAGSSDEEIWNAMAAYGQKAAGPDAEAEEANRQSESEAASGRKNELNGQPKKARRASRFSHLGLCAVRAAANAVPERIGALQTERIGAVFTTAYGPLETNMEFARQMIGDEPDLCSPSLFANTVHNACLGTISMDLGIKGPSTMLLGSNHLLLTRLLLNEGKADLILAGAIEEYNEELERSLLVRGMPARRIGEAAVVVGLAADEAALPGMPGQDAGIRIGETISFGLGAGAYEPFPSGLIEAARLPERIARFLRKHRPDAVLGHEAGTPLGEAEREAVRAVLLTDRTEERRLEEAFEERVEEAPQAAVPAGSAGAINAADKAASSGLRPREAGARTLSAGLGRAGGIEEEIGAARGEAEPSSSMRMLDGFYGLFGHCLGSDMALKIAASKLCLERGATPFSPEPETAAPRELRRIAVFSAEVTGNYSMTIVEKRPQGGR